MFCLIYGCAVLLKIAVYLIQGLVFVLAKALKLTFAALKLAWQLVQLIAVGLAALVIKIKEVISDKLDERKYSKKLTA